MTYFSREASKSHIAGVLAFLLPILTYIQAEGDWSWRVFAGAVLSGVISAVTVYAVPNQTDPETRSLRRGRRTSYPGTPGEDTL